MGSAIGTGAGLLGFLADAVTRTPAEALRTRNLQDLVGRPIEEMFLGLMEYFCPDGGSVHEGIAREAFIETIASLPENGFTDFDALTSDQLQTVFELYVTNAIEARICNDIATKAIILPSDATAVETVQSQLRDFVRRSASDAIAGARTTFQSLTPDRARAVVEDVYELAFGVLQALAEATMEAA